jgi:hypothetical protein
MACCHPRRMGSTDRENKGSALQCSTVQFLLKYAVHGRGLKKGGVRSVGAIIFSLLGFGHATHQCAARTRLLGACIRSMYSTMGPLRPIGLSFPSRKWRKNRSWRKSPREIVPQEKNSDRYSTVYFMFNRCKKKYFIRSLQLYLSPIYLSNH